jgi:hypothetical protein
MPRTSAITRLRPSGFDLKKRLIRNSGAFLCAAGCLWRCETSRLASYWAKDNGASEILKPVAPITIGHIKPTKGWFRMRVTADFILAVDDTRRAGDRLTHDACVDFIALCGACAGKMRDVAEGCRVTAWLESLRPKRWL